jgi:integrase/recombinase XerD
MVENITRRDDIVKKRGLDDLINAFIFSLDVKESSRDTYHRSLKQFFVWVKKQDFSDFTRESILAYKRELIKNLSPFTVSLYLTAVKSFFAWAEGMKYYPNIAKDIKGAKRSKGFKKDALTVDQAREFINTIKRSTPKGKRDFAILNLMIRTGLRTIEIVRADVKDIRNQGKKAVLLVQGKGGDDKDEPIVLTNKTLIPIQEYLKERNKLEPSSPLFAGLGNKNNGGRLTTRYISMLAKNHLISIGLNNPRLTAHSLRHSAITFSLLGGATLQEAQSLGRHADINTTLIYSHNIKRLENAPEYKVDALLETA